MENQIKTETVKLTTLTYGGECMGRLADGRAIFVPFSLPGETVRVEIIEDKRNYARGRLLETVVAAPERVLPRCRHFGVCGGCHYQHMDYPAQLAAKREIVIDQLRRIAGVAEPEVEPVVPSPQPWNYRNTVQFHLDPQGKIGYQAGDRTGSCPSRSVSYQKRPWENCGRNWISIRPNLASG